MDGNSLDSSGSSIWERRSSRRDVLKAAAAGLTYAALASPLTAAAKASARREPRPQMNILFIMVDQMRAPWVYMPPVLWRRRLPAIAALAASGVRFSHYYTSSNMCTPSRATQATGLYTHQNGIFATTPPTELNPGFPTFGTMLRQQGYDTHWFGKWHLSGGWEGTCPTPDPLATPPVLPAYEEYGFTADPGGGTCPSPNGSPGQGQKMDAVIRQEFVDWLRARASDERKFGRKPPWLATVSLLNPHDISEYPRFTRRWPIANAPPSVFAELPDTFETPAQRRARGKPLMQTRAMELENEFFGFMPRDGSPKDPWVRMLDTYLWMQQMVDLEIAFILKELRMSPYASTTHVVFTSDHGEYAGSHGMRGKAFAFYDEAVRVPLIVRDPTGAWTNSPGSQRDQMVESVDLAALFLTLATGGDAWRGDSRYAHIAGRADIAAIARDPGAPGRPYIAYATDEPGSSDTAPTPQEAKPAPNHIVGVRTRRGKAARYAFWKKGTLEIDESRRIDREVYDYSTTAGRQELDSLTGRGRLTRSERAFVVRMDALLDRAVQEDIQAPVPPALKSVQDAAFDAWFSQESGYAVRQTFH